jgi:hypothetical protein
VRALLPAAQWTTGTPFDAAAEAARALPHFPDDQKAARLHALAKQGLSAGTVASFLAGLGTALVRPSLLAPRLDRAHDTPDTGWWWRRSGERCRCVVYSDCPVRRRRGRGPTEHDDRYTHCVGAPGPARRRAL